MQPNSEAGLIYARRAGLQRAGLPVPSDDMIYFGGKTIPDLVFATFYVSGAAWDPREISSIDATMSDPNLNDIVQQYFDVAITSRFSGSRLLEGDVPETLSQSDIESMMAQQ